MPDLYRGSRPQSIVFEGVKTHNLKNISCHIPIGTMTVLTGVSGSGKSSLAFDTLYAESQRRFLESMSTYVRYFLNEMPKPPVDHVENCLPAIAFRQQSSFDHPRATVASVTEIWFNVSQVFASAGHLSCPKCGGRVESDTNAHIVEVLRGFGRDLRLIIHAEVALNEGESAATRLEALARLGYQRLWQDGQIVDLSEGDVASLLDATSFPVLIDRLIFKQDAPPPPRLAEALEEGFRIGSGKVRISLLGDAPQALLFDRAYSCRQCGQAYTRLRPEAFDPNSTLGACPTCTGLGRTAGISWHKVIDNRLSLADDAIRPLSTPARRQRKRQLLDFCVREKIDIHAPFHTLSAKARETVLMGKGAYHGVMSFFESLQSNQQKFVNRITLARYRGYSPCESCEGTGFSPIARHVAFAGRTAADVFHLSVQDARDYFDAVDASVIEANGLDTAIEATRLRLHTLCDVGLGYLGLDRRTKTLSGGEAQRLHLSCGLGRGLTDTLYVLDEPTAGLHPRDSARLVKVMHALRDIGNTIVVVEHDLDVITHADNVLELGPYGGERGGRIIYEGDVAGLRQSETPSGRMLRSEARMTLAGPAKASADFAPGYIEIYGASAHNLKDIDVRIPLHQLVTVAGVSGSGKSSLVHDVLYGWIQTHRQDTDASDGDDARTDVEAGSDDIATARCRDIRGLDRLTDVIIMGQGSLGRSLRSTVVTTTRAFSAIRNLLAGTSQAKNNDIKPGAFSFNVASGRCPQCEGLGYKTIEMLFMSDIVVPCETCQGKRYLPEVLAVRYRDKNIFDILEMTVKEAIDFFAEERSVSQALLSLIDVGLDYVRLGQSTSTLSAGEFQRLRLAGFLDAGSRTGDHPLYIFDEPTVGLHMQDVAGLIQALQKLVQTGTSVIVVEHNLDFIAQSDHVIELGPDAGPFGGQVVFEGSPRELAKADTLTGKALARAFL
ncbi:MAG: excinuclease ABC subunit UvrA [Proteobacteria bacterium]|nr:excinuclease ABC subunit UvrA [Pseudomonadota bacterium]